MSIFVTDLLPLLHETSLAVMDIYARDVPRQRKRDGSMVTEADKKANNILTEGLRHFIDCPILSEETGDDVSKRLGRQIWIIDPLDGTNDFLQKTGEFSIMVGLVEDGRPVLGVVAVPALGYVLYATQGGGAWRVEDGREPEKIETLKTDTMENATLVVSRSHFGSEMREIISCLKPKHEYKVGSNGIKIGLIAEGKADLFFNPTHKMGEWDAAGPHIILEEAGGAMMDMDGNPLVYNKKVPNIPRGIVATNGYLDGRIGARGNGKTFPM